MDRSSSLRGALAVAVLAVVAACTSTPAASTAPSASGLSVQKQITATSTGIDDAIAAYKAGDKAKAYELAGDAYLEHFEFVEGSPT